MANENIQMMYWHTNIGNLEELNKALLDYYISRLDSFEECAKNFTAAMVYLFRQEQHRICRCLVSLFL